MSKQTQGTMLMVGALAGTVGLIAFVALMVLGEYAFSPALFLAIIVAGAAGVFLMIGFHRKPAEPMLRQAHAPTPRAAAPRPHPVAPGPGNAASPSPNAAPAATTPVRDTAAAPTETPAASTGAPSSSVSDVAPLEPSVAPVSAPSTAPAVVAQRPAALSGPRETGADNLQRIKGVGPKLEELSHSLGFYHFDQIAQWSDAEVAWVDDNLEGFKGRVSRDDWVPQARLLAAGGDTEFSKKVNDGTVY